jgi:hypothetical protein
MIGPETVSSLNVVENKREMFVGFIDINLAVVFAQDGYVCTGQLR